MSRLFRERQYEKEKLETTNQGVLGLDKRGLLISIVIGALAIVLLARIIIPAEYTGNYQTIDANTPPSTAAVMVLCILLLINVAVKRLGKFKTVISKPIIVTVFSMVSLGGLLLSQGMYYMPAMLVTLPSGPLRGGSLEKYGPIIDAISSLIYPKDEALVVGFFVGSDFAGLEGVPWRGWIGPILVWSFIGFCLYWAMLCFAVIFRQFWTERESLTYPLTHPIQGILQIEGDPYLSRQQNRFFAQFWRNKLVYIGIVLVTIPSLMTLLNKYFPIIPAVSISMNLAGKFLPDVTSLAGFYFTYHPLVIGISYVVPTNVLFSLWFFSLLRWVHHYILWRLGYYWSNQAFPTAPRYFAMGAAVATAIVLIWTARDQLKRMFECAIGAQVEPADENEIIPLRLAFWSGLGAILIVLLFTTFGLHTPIWMSLLYFIVYFAVTITAARARVMAGIPSYNLSPTNYSQFVPWILMDYTTAMGVGGLAPFFNFEGEGGFDSVLGISLEAYKLGDTVRIRRTYVTIALIAAFIVGMATVFTGSLSIVYREGITYMEGARQRLNFFC